MTLETQIQSLLDAANKGNKSPATLAIVKERVLAASRTGQGWSWTVSSVLACVDDVGPATVVLVVIDDENDEATVGVRRSKDSPVKGPIGCGASWEDELYQAHGAEATSDLDRLRIWSRKADDDRIRVATKNLLEWART